MTITIPAGVSVEAVRIDGNHIEFLIEGSWVPYELFCSDAQQRF